MLMEEFLPVSLIFCYLYMVYGERKIEGVDICSAKSYGATDQFCLKDGSGYESWFCYDKKSSNGHNIWIKATTVKCEKSKKCKCHKNKWKERECTCVDAKRLPSFPDTGIIRWNGTLYYEKSSWFNKEYLRSVYIPGEIQKDEHGRILHKWTNITCWPKSKSPERTKMQFQILIPLGNFFIKYSGDGNSKSCKVSIQKKGRNLTSIWKQYSHGDMTFKLNESKPKERNVDIENWKLISDFNGRMDHLEWTVEYDKKTNYSIPLNHYHRRKDLGGDLQITYLSFIYEQFNGHDESFRLEDYCLIFERSN